MKNKAIVIGGNHYNTLGLVRSLGSRGISVALLLENCTRRSSEVVRSKYVGQVIEVNGAPDILDTLRNEFIQEENKPVVFAASDTCAQVVDSNFEELSKKYHLFNARRENSRVGYYINKSNTFPVAERCGLRLIKTIYGNGSCEIPKGIKFPCILKGDNSVISAKNDLSVCNNYDELSARWRPGVDFLIQEYIRKDYELDIVGVSFENGREVFFPTVVRKVRDEIYAQSMSVRVDDVSEYPDLPVEAIKAFVKEIGYEGLFSVELLHSGSKFYFLEINLRNDGCACVCAKAGVDFAYLWYLYATGRDYKAAMSRVKLRNHFRTLHDADIYNVFFGKTKFLTWVKDLYRADAMIMHDWHDLGPTIGMVKTFVRKMMGKLIGVVTRR